MFRFIKIIFINLIFLILGIIFVELIFGKWFGNNNFGSLIIPKYSVTIINQPYYDKNGTFISSWDRNGFRANTYALDEIDILVIGGSTTAERFIDNNHIWTKVFERHIKNKTNYKVLNAGIGGQTIYGHKNMFDLWFSKFPDLAPKYIMIYFGINDAIKINESIQRDLSNIVHENYSKIKADNLLSVSLNNRIIQYIKNNSAIHLFYLIIRSAYISNKHQINNPNGIKLFDSKSSKDISNSNEKLEILSKEKKIIIKNYLPEYKKNIISVINYSKKLSAEPILITNILPNDNGTSSYAKTLSSYLYLLNDTTMSVCYEQKITCFDLRNKINFIRSEDFYDPIHTTPSGSAKLGKKISELFISSLK